MNEPELSPSEDPRTDVIPDIEPVAALAAPPCSFCQAARVADINYCGDCGYIFPDASSAVTQADLPGLIAGRYRLLDRIVERGGVERYRAEDIGNPEAPIPVIIVRQLAGGDSQAALAEAGSVFEFDLLERSEQATSSLPDPVGSEQWPGIAWEQGVLLRAAHLSLPRLIDSFNEEDVAYLVEEVPSGASLWDEWDRVGITNRERFTWMIQLAQAIDRLHFAGAMLEGLRPEMIVVSRNGIAILADLSELLPTPLPGDVPLRGGFSTAPELLLNQEHADERADLYAFGALIYALMLGRELSDLDFTLTGMPRPYLERVPDANPFLSRLLAKTFVRDMAQRFPADDGPDSDRTGFRELIACLEACKSNLDRVKIDVAAWSTTGMVRPANEDGVAVFYWAESRLDDSDGAALILLADGMGGMESGEVAAALALQTLKECLLTGPPFATGLPSKPLSTTPTAEALVPDWTPVVENASGTSLPLPGRFREKESPERSVDGHAERVANALREANRRVFETAYANPGSRGMGCTAEVILVDGNLALVGHVGDSRVYRMKKGKLTQVTKDHTVIARLIELGQLTEEEAELHPRRSELQQAIGGRPEVYPDVYAIILEPGDWILACSDGLSNQLGLDVMQGVLRETKNAERAARRLINMALFDGAQDNVTVAVVRAS